MARSGFTQEWLDDHLAKKAARLGAIAVKPEVVAPPPKVRMNKTEQRYADEILEPMLRAGQIKSYGFERVRLRLADSTFYWPDFDVVLDDNTVCIHEVKGGFIREDSWVKLKVAAELYPHMLFVRAQYDKKQWELKIIGR